MHAKAIILVSLCTGSGEPTAAPYSSKGAKTSPSSLLPEEIAGKNSENVIGKYICIFPYIIYRALHAMTSYFEIIKYWYCRTIKHRHSA